jgi:hypothetical protein
VLNPVTIINAGRQDAARCVAYIGKRLKRIALQISYLLVVNVYNGLFPELQNEKRAVMLQQAPHNRFLRFF